MCLPCFTEVFVEEEVVTKKKEKVTTVWDASTKRYIRVPKTMPQVGTDTTHGPHLHQYIPRSDGSILVGGVSYIPHHVSVPATVASVPVPVVSAPIVVQPASPVVQAPYPSNPFYSFLYPSYIPPAMVQPIMVPQQAYIPPPHPMYVPQSVYGYPAASSPYQTYPIPTNPAFSFQQHAYNTVGYTAGEMLTQNMGLAMNSDANKKQEMKPADDDPYRMYWCREQDNTWTQRNRLTIDSGDIGDTRWYAVDGQFYCIRL